ncbi:MAG: YIP1 family protein [Gemmatimonadota bacterium]
MPEQPFESVTTPPAEAPPAASLWEDFIDIFYAPSAVFERRRGAKWWPMLVILTIVMVVLFYFYQRILSPVFDAELQRQMASRAQQLTPQQMENARRVTSIIRPLTMVIGFPITIFVLGLVTWALGFAFGGAMKLGSVVLVVTYAQIVKVLQLLAGIVQSFFLDVGHMTSIHQLSLGLDRFLSPDMPAVLLGLASRVEVFTLWATVLLAIGLHVVGRLPKGRAYAVAFLVWALGAIPIAVGALINSR